MNDKINKRRVTRKRITIALLLILLIFLSGCINVFSGCTPETSSKHVNIEEKDVLACTEACHKYGLSWRTQVYGQSEGRDVVYCTCYTCLI